MPFSCGALYSAEPMRLAGIISRYSKKAMPQLTRITFHSATSLNFRCAYQAKVMKTLDATSNKGGRMRS